MTASELVAAARRLIDYDDNVFVGVWPRATALLARQALEQAMADLWVNGRAGNGGMSMDKMSAHAQLLCLDSYLGNEVVSSGTRLAWWALSRACHHHPYELSPTREELTRWLAAVEDLDVAVGQLILRDLRHSPA